MKLLLTSTGLSTKNITDVFLAELKKDPSDCRVLMIAYAISDEERVYVEDSKREMVQLGFKEIKLLNLHNQINIKALTDFDVIYVCGGNTFSILDQIRRHGLDSLIVNLVKNGSFYVGVSAGSILAGPDIAIAGWDKTWDKNLVGLKDTTGFNLVDFAVAPHFTEKERDILKRKSKDINYRVIPITDAQAVLVRDNGYQIIGDDSKAKL
ncbi:MAG: Type 1 glutamine amidotransferase-like domain-containing protein [bacterium]|nr:Type 1 glutamine amidotransferase-like domain-containing protein [bacterium]